MEKVFFIIASENLETHYCRHIHDEDDLFEWLKTKNINDPLCKTHLIEGKRKVEFGNAPDPLDKLNVEETDHIPKTINNWRLILGLHPSEEFEKSIKNPNTFTEIMEAYKIEYEIVVKLIIFRDRITDTYKNIIDNTKFEKEEISVSDPHNRLKFYEKYEQMFKRMQKEKEIIPEEKEETVFTLPSFQDKNKVEKIIQYQKQVKEIIESLPEKSEIPETPEDIQIMLKEGISNLSNDELDELAGLYITWIIKLNKLKTTQEKGEKPKRSIKMPDKRTIMFQIVKCINGSNKSYQTMNSEELNQNAMKFKELFRIRKNFDKKTSKKNIPFNLWMFDFIFSEYYVRGYSELEPIHKFVFDGNWTNEKEIKDALLNVMITKNENISNMFIEDKYGAYYTKDSKGYYTRYSNESAAFLYLLYSCLLNLKEIRY